jgi:3-hexulose-6-phosphate synthase
MKLQVAFDFNFDEGKICKYIDLIGNYIDFIEVGTPVLMEQGLGIVTNLKKRYPKQAVLADLKIADAGFYEANAAFEASADIVTVLAVADDMTIQGAVEAARRHSGQIMVDMLSVAEMTKRLAEIDRMGVDFVCLHTSKDRQSTHEDFSACFAQLKGHVKQSKLALAGGISLTNIARYVAMCPEVVIVGEAITGASDLVGTCRKIRTAMDEGR